MATCGKCKETGVSVEHVRSCYASSVAVLDKPMALEDTKPMAFDVKVPDSKYALYDDEGKIIFYEVRTGKGKWAHMQFVDHLVGAPGDWQRYPVKGDRKRQVLLSIAARPKAAVQRFGKHFTVCGVCGSPLSDNDSIAAGVGPICAARF